MITVHHLNESRSQRILWLLEELGLPYEIKFYKRDAQTNLAPPELKAVHPLGKSPVITDDGRMIAESGAIVDYIVRRHGGGRLAPGGRRSGLRDVPGVAALRRGLGHAAADAAALHAAARRGGRAVAAAHRQRDRQPPRLRRPSLEGRDYLLGDQLTAADVQMSFVGELGRAFGRLADKPEPRRLGGPPARPFGLQARAAARRPLCDRAIAQRAAHSSVRSSPNGRRLYCAAATAIPQVGQSLRPTHQGVHSFQQVRSATAGRTRWLTCK